MKQYILKYIGKIPGAISGKSGHNKTFAVACKLILGFDLSVYEALPYFIEYNKKCIPPWNKKELLHKLRDADKKIEVRGYLNQTKRNKCLMKKIILPDPKTIQL